MTDQLRITCNETLSIIFFHYLPWVNVSFQTPSQFHHWMQNLSIKKSKLKLLIGCQCIVIVKLQGQVLWAVFTD